MHFVFVFVVSYFLIPQKKTLSTESNQIAEELGVRNAHSVSMQQ